MQKVKYSKYTYINNAILHMTAVYADHLKLFAIFIGQYFDAVNLMQ